MKTRFLTTPTPTQFAQALRSDRPLSQPLTQAEKWVLCVLMKCRQGEEPADDIRNDILWITKTDRCQWARIVAANPAKAEIVQAVNEFFCGNLIERSVSSKSKPNTGAAGAAL